MITDDHKNNPARMIPMKDTQTVHFT